MILKWKTSKVRITKFGTVANSGTKNQYLKNRIAYTIWDGTG